MSHFSSTPFQRGASVLAALVLAAFMASIALLVQMGQPGPVDVSQTAAASTATTATAPANSSTTGTDQVTNCVAGYNYRVVQQGSQPVTQCVHDMDCKTDIPQTSTTKSTDSQATKGQCAQTSGTVAAYDEAKCKAWKCKTAYCVADSTNPSSYKCMSVAGDGVSPGQNVSTADTKKAVAQSLVDKLGSGTATKEQIQNTLKQDPSLQKAFDDAFSNRADEIQKQVDQETVASNSAADALERLGCGSPTAATNVACAQYKHQQDAATQKLVSLTDEYAKLQGSSSTLKPTGQNISVPPAEQPGNIPSGDNPYSGPGGTFGGQPVPQMPKGGSPGGSSGSGSGGTSQTQKQCQPQYVCNGNSVTYLPCANLNQNGAQIVQQCPTGYTCQNGSYSGSNSSCQPQAIYGYCSDGRTPRTGPAQTQPSASTCTVGTWQDTSNGCQTGWQCVAGNATTTASQPTAQLSCQPLVATNGTIINFSYACAGGSTQASASNFSIASSSLSGTATTTAVRPSGTNTVTYGLTCTNASVSPNLTASVQCQVQVGAASIVMVALPEKITKTETDETKRKATIGWVTTGMQSCSISSSLFAGWTSQQASNTSVNGAAVSPVLTDDTTFVLTCQTVGGSTASSSVTVLAI